MKNIIKVLKIWLGASLLARIILMIFFLLSLGILTGKMFVPLVIAALVAAYWGLRVLLIPSYYFWALIITSLLVFLRFAPYGDIFPPPPPDPNAGWEKIEVFPHQVIVGGVTINIAEINFPTPARDPDWEVGFKNYRWRNAYQRDTIGVFSLAFKGHEEYPDIRPGGTRVFLQGGKNAPPPGWVFYKIKTKKR